jgi:hypothetical protein
MALHPTTFAKRALVSLLLALSRVYRLELNVSRDSPDTDVEKAFKKTVRRAHPDKGGSLEEAQQLNAARDKWVAAKAQQGSVGRPAASQGHTAAQPEPPAPPTPVPGALAAAIRAYRIHATAVLLTFQT